MELISLFLWMSIGIIVGCFVSRVVQVERKAVRRPVTIKDQTDRIYRERRFRDDD